MQATFHLRIGGTALCKVYANRGDTIAVMAKFKPVRKKPRAAPLPQGGLPCVILVVTGILLLMLFFYFWMRSNAS
jgi:hypothetical protein